ncbi:DUF362 domain-containing protein [Pelotomaculum isophthalicicum JI]|uniref:DUF362 domain-containing protein n=1 Tax=Pelotomaculum isophthalicicum JI TaxID=947010 RepID=A0A9X4GZX6_9FIRM|nr:DUF362 domain-containing protein [Pelotomaculum isophthalicicum]MDF9406786.1 DUF362 domain-containing protein [Pelotomaculum isophthalicicum JI]
MREQIAVGVTIPAYNNEAPYHPYVSYPEVPFSETSKYPNFPYHLLRQLFLKLGLDKEHYGTPHWNPLGAIIRLGQTVLIKPNFVLSSNLSGGDLFAVVTHPSIIRALIDYIYIALKGTGRIIVADAPQMDCDWEQLMAAQRLDTIQTFYRRKFSFEIELYDLRNFALIDPSKPAYSENRKELPGDPQGSVIINLGRESEFYGLPSENYYGADYNRNETIRHHQGEIHEYCVSETVLSADVIISVPKMKVHKKVGVTLNLKGLVGINTNKNYLIHYRVGTAGEGGDQLPNNLKADDLLLIKIQRWLYDHALAKQNKMGDSMYKWVLSLYRFFIKPFMHVDNSIAMYDGGNWHGNDTAWRMTADLAKILFFADSQGNLCDKIQRNFFCVVDGIAGGENNGPLAPDVKRCGCLVAGRNPLAVDLVTARLMGFDIKKIKQFSMIFKEGSKILPCSAEDINIILNGLIIKGRHFFDDHWDDPVFGFKPHPGWTGHIEISQDRLGR